jgi:hypothetical protein
LTTAVANAIAITLDKGARASWDRQVARDDQQPAQSKADFGATVNRLAAMFPGAVKVH